MKHFISRSDVTDIQDLLNKASYTQQHPYEENTLGKNKTMVLLFFNPSLRTKLSTQKAAMNLGMQVIPIEIHNSWQIEFEEGTIMNMDKAEHIIEAAKVISSYADIIGIRTFPTFDNRESDYQDFIIQQFLKYATVPIINMESAILHPLQSFTDLFTIEQFKKKKKPKVVLTWAPHPKVLPQAVANSFMEWMQLADYELVITHPKGYELAEQYTNNCTIEYDQEKAFNDADFIYAKNWSSYTDYGKILSTNSNWMITSDKMNRTNHAYFMHCLPVRRNVVVADDVIDSSQSLVIPQAANRAVIAQTIIAELLKSNL